jgi:hypothetical protein
MSDLLSWLQADASAARVGEVDRSTKRAKPPQRAPREYLTASFISPL